MLPNHFARFLFLDRQKIDSLFDKHMFPDVTAHRRNASGRNLQDGRILKTLKSVVAAIRTSGSSEISRVLATSVTMAANEKRRKWFCGIETFGAPQFRNARGPEIVSESRYLALTCDKTKYVYSDDYYKRARFKANMTCDLSMMPFSKDGMGFTGKDANYLRRNLGTRIPLGVFCSVLPRNGFAQLVPFAVWRVPSAS